MSITVKDYLQVTAERNGFTREKHEDIRLPGDFSDITVMSFFGDLRSSFVLSSLLLGRYKEELKGSKYFIFCSWPGHHALYPYVDEYWSISDESQLRKMNLETDGFLNRSDTSTVYFRNLGESFRNIGDVRLLKAYYNNGITNEFWNKFKHIKRVLPMVPSVTLLGKEFNRILMSRAGYKVFIYPSLTVNVWRNGRSRPILITKEFWVSLVNRLLREKMVPILWKHPLSYDLSSEFPTECVHIQDMDIGRIMGLMRASGCVLDIFNGISRLALAARCPFLVCDERSRYVMTKEWEIDDLCGYNLPKQYIFSFSTIIESGSWESNLFNGIVAKLNSFLPGLDRDNWPSTSESVEIVPYEMVRKKKRNRFGTKFIKIPRD